MYVRFGLRQVAASGEPLMVYLHPWEIDDQQPRLRAGLKSRVRQYTGLKGMRHRLEKLLDRYEFGTVAQVYGMAQSGMKQQRVLPEHLGVA
jgi:hypothetical protein